MDKNSSYSCIRYSEVKIFFWIKTIAYLIRLCRNIRWRLKLKILSGAYTGNCYIRKDCYISGSDSDHGYQMLMYPDDIAPDDYEPNDRMSTSNL